MYLSVFVLGVRSQLYEVLCLESQDVTKRQSKCLPGLWSHGRLAWGRISFQVHATAGSLPFFAEFQSEGLSFLSAVSKSLPSAPCFVALCSLLCGPLYMAAYNVATCFFKARERVSVS